MTESPSTVFDDASDVTHSTAFAILNTLVDEGHIVEERADYLKQKFKDLHNRVLTIYKRDNTLLKRARLLRSQLDTERGQVQAKGEVAKKDDEEIQLLKRQVVELEKELTTVQERESVLQVEVLEMDRRKQNYILEREDAMAAEEARLRPKIERTKQEINDMGEEIKSMITECDSLQKKKEELTQEEEELKIEIGSFSAVFAQHKQQYANLERDPERATKQLQLVKRSLTAANLESTALDEKLKLQQENLLYLEVMRSTRAKDLASARGQKKKILADLASKRKTLHTLATSLEVEIETKQGYQDRLLELEMLIKTTRITKNQEEDALEKVMREKEKEVREYAAIQKAITESNQERQQLKNQQHLCKRTIGDVKRKAKELGNQIKVSESEMNAKRKLLLQEQAKDKWFTEKANIVLEDIANAEDLANVKRGQEEAKRKEWFSLVLKRQELARECVREAKREAMTVSELRTKEVHFREAHRWQDELQKQLDSITQQFQRMKRERSQLAAQIQAIAQKMTEVAEKTKILQNELEVLLRECGVKEKELHKKVRRAHELTQACTHLRLEKNKNRKKLTAVSAKEMEVVAQVRRMNIELTMIDDEMTAIQLQYERAIDSRNQSGVLLIDRNDEASLLVEKAKAQEAAIELGAYLTNQRTEELARLRRRLADVTREVDVCRRSIPKVKQLEDELQKLLSEIDDETWRVEVLEKDLISPTNPHRWRHIDRVLPTAPELLPVVPPAELQPSSSPGMSGSGVRSGGTINGSGEGSVEVLATSQSDAYVELQARCQDLEARVQAINEKLREKHLVLAEVTELAERVGNHAESGKAFTLALAREVNEHQSNVRRSTRSMMATVSELSLFQASSIQLQRKVKFLEEMVEEAEKRMEEGLVPFAEAEEEYQRSKSKQKLFREAQERRAVEKRELENASGGLTRTTAAVRPNSYIPDDQLGLPMPFHGTLGPYRGQSLPFQIEYQHQLYHGSPAASSCPSDRLQMASPSLTSTRVTPSAAVGANKKEKGSLNQPEGLNSLERRATGPAVTENATFGPSSERIGAPAKGNKTSDDPNGE